MSSDPTLPRYGTDFIPLRTRVSISRFGIYNNTFFARRLRVSELFAVKISSRTIRCWAFVNFSQFAFAVEFLVMSSFNSSGRSSEARRIFKVTSSPVSSFARLQSGSGRSIHQQFRSSQRFIERRPSSVSLIVPSITVVSDSFQGAMTSSGMVTSRENCGW